MQRFARSLLIALLMATSLLATAGRSSAVPNGWAASGDYATEELGNPWDFSSDADWDIQARLESNGISNAGVSGGTLKFDAVGGAQGYVLIGSAHYGPDALQWGTSTALAPITTAIYKTVSLRLYSPSSTPAGLDFYTCPYTIPNCDVNIGFVASAGWHTYTFDVGSNPGWVGNVYQFRVTPLNAGHYEIDYLRVLRAGGSVDPVNEPIPVVVDPDRTGGRDYAATVRHNAWDFNGPDDVAWTENVNSVSFGNGQMRGCSTNNDPGVILAMGPPLDGNVYNRFYAHIYYEGGFSLANGRGGGMNARIQFRTLGASAYQVSQDIVVYPGWNDIDVELGTNPPNAMLDENMPGVGWAGQLIDEIRFDPHEDQAPRCFVIDEIRLSAADTAAPHFDVQFRDDANGTGAPSAGTTAEVWLDSGKGAFGGIRIANGVPVQAGVNHVAVPGGIPYGTYWVWVRLRNPQGKESSAYSRGPLVVAPPLPLPAGSNSQVGSGVSGSAALVNLTMTQAQFTGYLTADRCDTVLSVTNEKSNGNYTPAQDNANLGVVPIDGQGNFCIYNSADVHEIADIQGVFSGGGSLGFTGDVPTRIFNTRVTGKPGAGSLLQVSTGAPAGTAAVLVNLTMAEADAPGYITAGRCSDLRADTNPDKQYSNGNYTVNGAIANMSVVPLDSDGTFCIFTKTPVNVLVDLLGRFSPGGPLKFASSAFRFDTRAGAKPQTGTIFHVPTNLPGGTPYALVNLTMTREAAGGYVTAERCSVIAGKVDSVSNGNFMPGRDIANLTVVPLDPDGGFCIYVSASADVVVDVQGSFAGGNPLKFSTYGPVRAFDSRR